MGLSPQPPQVVLPLSHYRQVSIHNLEASRQSTAPVTVVAEVDCSGLKAVYDTLKPQAAQHLGAPLTYLPFFARATVLALQAYPIMNSMLTPNGFVIPRQINLGIATSIPGAVLLPTLWNAERKPFWQLAREAHQLTQRAKAEQLSSLEMSGQTFVISNTGSLGGTLFGTPVIKPPNIGALAFEEIKKRPVVLENDQIVARPMMYIALTADHRAVDGAEMIGFLNVVKNSLEQVRM